ncbi:MAG: DUF2927 domain-containing protein [Pseudomonadota bacterium]
MRARNGISVAAAALTLAGCMAGGVKTSPTPPERPDRAARPVVAIPGRSPESLALEAYYARVQADLLARGLLRRDGGGPDTPFNARTLTENFVRIALFDEYTERGGAMVASQTESRLRRWSAPVRLQVSFGPLVPLKQRSADLASINAYAGRLARAARHPISTVTRGGNFHVVIMNEDERKAFGPQLRRIVPGVSDTVVRTVQNMPRSTFCLVFAFSEGNSSDYVKAVAIIRAEHPDLLRLSCIHEEISQGLGLANDSPRARPSIFNDDEEFALLTTHDELLLRMLYDKRLKPGMTSFEASPIARAIADELVGGSI